MKILAIIPAFNAESSIGDVILNVGKYLDDILVVDDGSTDATAREVTKSGVNLISHPQNLGKGEALKTGFGYALDHEFELVLTVDADGQHDPDYIPAFINRCLKTGADMVIGSRADNKADMTWDRRFSNFTTSLFLSLMLKVKIDDSQCGFRLIKASLLRKLELYSSNFELESEIIIKSIKAGFKIDFVAIVVKYGKQFDSQIKRGLDTYRWLKMVLEEI